MSLVVLLINVVAVAALLLLLLFLVCHLHANVSALSLSLSHTHQHTHNVSVQPVACADVSSLEQPLAIAHYMMGMKCFPPTVKDPSVIAQLYLQSCAIEMTTDQLAVVASTLACLGTCPTTSKRCIEPALAKLVLSTLYSCGMTDVCSALCIITCCTRRSACTVKFGIWGGVALLIDRRSSASRDCWVECV